MACKTNRSPCCRTPPNRFGNWIYNNITIGNRAQSGLEYFRSRDDNQRFYLSLRNNSVNNPLTGNFCCIIPDFIDTQTECLNIGKYW